MVCSRKTMILTANLSQTLKDFLDDLKTKL